MATSKKRTRPVSGSKKNTKGKATAETSPLAAVMESKERYKRWFGQMLKVCVGSVALNVALLITLVIIIANEAPPQIIAVTDDYRVRKLPALTKQHISDARLSQWVQTTIPEILSLDFDKWRKTLRKARQFFSPTAFPQFVELLQREGWINQVENKNMIIRFVITAPPQKNRGWIQGGRRTFEIMAPVQYSLLTTNGVVSKNSKHMRLIVQRCSTLDNPRGFWITHLQIY